MAEYEIEIPDHVARYLLRVAVDVIPPPVLKTLASMSEEELEVLDRLRASIDQAEFGPLSYVFAFH